MNYGLTSTRFAEVEKELMQMENYLVALAQEIRETTAPGFKYNHLWSQVDNTISYTRSLREALENKVSAQN